VPTVFAKVISGAWKPLSTWRRIFRLVMKLHFPSHKRSELRAALTVVAVLALGALAELDATIQLFRTRH
jgi:hypothetical protein